MLLNEKEKPITRGVQQVLERISRIERSMLLLGERHESLQMFCQTGVQLSLPGGLRVFLDCRAGLLEQVEDVLNIRAREVGVSQNAHLQVVRERCDALRGAWHMGRARAS